MVGSFPLGKCVYPPCKGAWWNHFPRGSVPTLHVQMLGGTIFPGEVCLSSMSIRRVGSFPLGKCAYPPCKGAWWNHFPQGSAPALSSRKQGCVILSGGTVSSLHVQMHSGTVSVGKVCLPSMSRCLVEPFSPGECAYPPCPDAWWDHCCAGSRIFRAAVALQGKGKRSTGNPYHRCAVGRLQVFYAEMITPQKPSYFPAARREMSDTSISWRT